LLNQLLFVYCLFMIFIVWSFVLQVWADVLDLNTCNFLSKDGTCSGPLLCHNWCHNSVTGEISEECSGKTCDQMLSGFQMTGMTDWGDCFNLLGSDVNTTCEDDGVADVSGSCDGSGICATLCSSTDETCSEQCMDIGMELHGYSCSDYESVLAGSSVGFDGYEQCFS